MSQLLSAAFSAVMCSLALCSLPVCSLMYKVTLKREPLPPFESHPEVYRIFMRVAFRHNGHNRNFIQDCPQTILRSQNLHLSMEKAATYNLTAIQSSFSFPQAPTFSVAPSILPLTANPNKSRMSRSAPPPSSMHLHFEATKSTF